MRIVVVIEGGIGAGKTTALRAVRASTNAMVVEEPVAAWQSQQWKGKSLLEAMYDGSLPNALFQTAIAPGRVSELVKALVKHKLVVAERSPWSERAMFARPKLSDEEFGLYAWSQQQLLDNLFEVTGPLRVVFVHLDVTPKVALTRIKQRNRAGEERLTLEALEALRAAHHSMFSLTARDLGNVAEVAHEIVNADRPADVVAAEVLAIVQRETGVMRWAIVAAVASLVIAGTAACNLWGARGAW